MWGKDIVEQVGLAVLIWILSGDLLGTIQMLVCSAGVQYPFHHDFCGFLRSP